MALVQAVILGSKTIFSYNPSDNEMRTYIALKEGKKANFYAKLELSAEQKQEAGGALIKSEREDPISEWKTFGDASESGLIKFCNPISNIDETRNTYPTFTYENGGS